MFYLIFAIVIAMWLLLKAAERLEAAAQENRALDLKLRCEQETTKRLRANRLIAWRDMADYEIAHLRWHLARCGRVIAEQEVELERYRGQRDDKGRYVKRSDR